MKKSNEFVEYLVVFPFLKCTEKISLYGVELFPSEQISEYTSEDALEKLCQMFYMNEKYLIKNMTACLIKEQYGLVDFGYNEEIHKNYGKVLKIREIFMFFYSSLHHSTFEPFMDISSCNVYAIRKEDRIIPIHIGNSNLKNTMENEIKSEEMSFTHGYYGLLNNRLITLEDGEKIFPSNPSVSINYNQDINNDINRVGSESLFGFIKDERRINIIIETDRIFKGLQWFNRTNNEILSDEEQLLYLSVAFESLMNLDKDIKITNRFKDSLKVLLGDNQRLDSWITQFYDARSEIVHTGAARELQYNINKAKNKKIKYLSLISYGKKIFQIVFNAIVNSELYKKNTKLDELFITNRERIELLIKKLDGVNDGIAVLNKYIKIIDEVEEYLYVGKEGILIKDLFKLLESVIYIYINEMSNSEKQVMDSLLNASEITDKLESYRVVYETIDNMLEDNLLKKINRICWHYLMFDVLNEHERRKAI